MVDRQRTRSAAPNRSTGRSTPWTRWRLLVSALVLGFTCAASGPAWARDCRPDLGGKIGAQLTAQVLRRGADGVQLPLGPPAADVAARAGDTVRIMVRPVEGAFRPVGPECPVRVSVGKLLTVGRLVSRAGFVVDEIEAYALLAPDEERVLDVIIKPFAEWDAAPDRIGVENVDVRLPETGEFASRLPAPFRPPPGTICADVVDPEARPAAGVTVGLAMPPDGPRDVREVGPSGRVCWEGLDPTRFGDVSLLGGATPALGMPKTRYVSAEASYRLFVVQASS
jgi:hypothetical protein